MQLVLPYKYIFGIVDEKSVSFYFLLMQLLTVISTIDDLNYPEKTDTYYIVNVPYVFSACWKVCGYIKCSYWRSILNILTVSERKKRFLGQ